ncbi:fructose-bisphosphatase class III, partial [uncultured Enorma sp.]|uniref:fructose-bisphosphatase class III n=1 Tax=uncultured Enorma sp. TaxID=1714346 RepID=UPI002804AD08
MPARDRLEQSMKYLSLLSQQFPTQQAAFTEIINLQAILNLPKGTEHFMSDLHGEYEAFMHILNNCSGVVREHVDETFGDELTETEKADLCTLIYYPHEKLAL